MSPLDSRIEHNAEASKAGQLHSAETANSGRKIAVPQDSVSSAAVTSDLKPWHEKRFSERGSTDGRTSPSDQIRDYDDFFQGDDAAPLKLGKLVRLAVKRFGITETIARSEIRASCRRSGFGEGEWESYRSYIRKIFRHCEVTGGLTIIPERYAFELYYHLGPDKPPDGMYAVRLRDGTITPFEKYYRWEPNLLRRPRF